MLLVNVNACLSTVATHCYDGAALQEHVAVGVNGIVVRADGNDGAAADGHVT